MRLFLILFLLVQPLVAQKFVSKTLASDSNKKIIINANFCYKVEVSSTKENTIVVEASLEGEYYNDLEVTLKEDANNLLIDANFQPDFQPPNDKLSAHKVVSIYLKIQIPENNHVQVYGTSCNVHFTGNYKHVKVDLADGNCFLNEVAELTVVNTFKGQITIFASSGSFETNSSYGKVFADEIPLGDNIYNLTTIEGDIYLRKNQ